MLFLLYISLDLADFLCTWILWGRSFWTTSNIKIHRNRLDIGGFLIFWRPGMPGSNGLRASQLPLIKRPRIAPTSLRNVRSPSNLFPPKTYMTSWKITMFNRRYIYIFKWSVFSIVMFVFRGCHPPKGKPFSMAMFEHGTPRMVDLEDEFPPFVLKGWFSSRFQP